MFLVLDGLLDIPCRLVHCQSGRDLSHHVDEIVEHLRQRGSPIPIGGDEDCSSKVHMTQASSTPVVSRKELKF